MTPKEQQDLRALINQAVRPVAGRVDQLERDVRRLKSDLQQTKSKINSLKK